MQKFIRLYKKKKFGSNIIYIVVVYKKIRSRFLEKLGFFNIKNPRHFGINLMRLGFWLNNGAVLKKAVKKYLVKLIN